MISVGKPISRLRLPTGRVCCTRKHAISKEFRFVERLRNLTIMLHKDFSPQKMWFEMAVKRVRNTLGRQARNDFGIF